MITSNYILFACICWNCVCLLQIRWTLSACVYCILALHVFTADTLWRLHVVLVLACNHGQLTSGCDSSAGQRWASCPGPSWPNIPHQFDHQILLLAAVETTMSSPKNEMILISYTEFVIVDEISEYLHIYHHQDLKNQVNIFSLFEP